MRYAVFLFAGLIGFAYGKYLGAAIFIYLAVKLYNAFAPGSRRFASFRARRAYDPYSILGVRPTDPMDVIKHAYHNLAKMYHPDAMKSRGASESEIKKAAEKMARINEAWRVVSSGRKNV